MKTILATAYAINPFKGSEDGMGWNFVLQIARFNKVIAITRENNRPHIEKFMRQNNSKLYENIQFIYFDLPYWMRFWKNGGQGAMLYYLMWQRGIIGFIKKQKLSFDIVHNLNFHNDWSPSWLWKLGKPFVWGPVGHHPSIPLQYLQKYAVKYRVINRFTWSIKKYFWLFSPSLKSTVKHAKHVICMHKAVPKNLGLSSNFSIMPSVATQDFGWIDDSISNQKFTIISAGRLVPLKGFDLAIASFAQFFHQLTDTEKLNCQLVVVGSGPEEAFLKNLAQKLQVYNHVHFITWIEREQLMSKFKTASAFLFPSHEGAGMVVAEALSFGLPVICLDNEGPGQFITTECGMAIAHQNYDNTVSALANALQTLFSQPELRQTMSHAARKRFETAFDWNRRGEQLQQIYSTISL